MKKRMIITCILFGTFLSAWSQIHLQLKVAFSPGSNPLSAPLFVNRDRPFEEFQFNMVNVKRQFYGGIIAHLQLKSPFFMEGGISYTKKTSLYDINYTYDLEPPQDAYMSESEDMILFPLNIGVNIGNVDITSGLTAMKTISKIKQLTHLKGFHQDENKVSLGWQMGVRYGFNRTMIGVEYQGTLNRVGQGMYVNGQSLEVMNVPGNLVFSVQYQF